MAKKEYYQDLDGLKFNILKDWRINSLTSTEISSLATTLNSSNEGLVVWNTTDKTQYTWNGTSFVKSNDISSALVFKGAVAADSATPTSPKIGDFYRITSTANNTWNGSSEALTNGDEAYFDGTTWNFIKNESTVPASDTVLGSVELSTNTEAIALTDTTRVLTPANLSAVITSKQLAKTYFVSGVSLVAGSAFTITHNLGLTNRNAFTINVMQNNSGVSVDYDSVDINSLTLTSNLAVTVDVCVIGY